MEQVARYYRFSRYLKETYGCRVWKVCVDAGFTCPNIDGTIGESGCLYCNERTFSYAKQRDTLPLEKQLERGIANLKAKGKADKFIVYFQDHTNTHAPVDVLADAFSRVDEYEDIVSLAIGTRPDCMSAAVCEVIRERAEKYDVWIELGVQSMHDETLKTIERGHTYAAFLEAVEQLRAIRNVKICAHIILGLPGESREMMMATAREMGRLEIDGIKIHPLHVVKGTGLADWYENDAYTPLTMDAYIALAAEGLTYLAPKTVIQRITAECEEAYLIAPDWIQNKTHVLNTLSQYLEKHDLRQGMKWEGAQCSS